VVRSFDQEPRRFSAKAGPAVVSKLRSGALDDASLPLDGGRDLVEREQVQGLDIELRRRQVGAKALQQGLWTIGVAPEEMPDDAVLLRQVPERRADADLDGELDELASVHRCRESEM